MKHIGPLDEKIVADKLLPMIRKLSRVSPAACPRRIRRLARFRACRRFAWKSP
jgi:hypothetical protein